MAAPPAISRLLGGGGKETRLAEERTMDLKPGRAVVLAVLFGLLAAPSASAQLGVAAGYGFAIDRDARTAAGEMPLRAVLTEGLVLTYRGDSPQTVRLHVALIEDGRIVRIAASEPFRLEPGRTRVASDRMIMSNISKLLGDRSLPGGEVLPPDSYVMTEEPLQGGLLIPALDGSSKDAGPLLDASTPKLAVRRGLLLALLPADARVARSSESRPLFAVIRKIGG